MEAKTISALEHAHISEMQQSLNQKLAEAQRRDGARDPLRRGVLILVVAENYDGAKDKMNDYVAAKSHFPVFQTRAQRYVKHCSELIHAIETKRNFPGLAQLSLSRQQEIHEKVMEHFEELKHQLRQIERIERDHRLLDIRSTVWVVKACSAVGFAVVFAAFLKDLRDGVLSSLIYTANLWVDAASTWITNLIM